jgi:hypothetical protein
MFNILIHKGNANQNYTKIPSYPSQLGNHLKNKKQMLARIRWKKEPSCTVVRMYTGPTSVEIIMEVHQKLKTDLQYDLIIRLLGIYPKECKSIYKGDNCTPMFIAAVFTIIELWNQLRCPTTDERIQNMVYSCTHIHTYIHMPWNIIQP